MASTYLIILFITVVIYVQSREILIDEDNTNIKTPTMRNFATEDDVNDNEVPCHMEYQVVKRVVGHCMKLGRSAKGCVAGNYLHPFHPECA